MSNRTWARKCKLLAAAASVLGLGWSAQGALISVNFVGGQGAAAGSPGSASVTGTAGAVPGGNWNNEMNPAEAAPVSIVDSAGSAAASLVYTSPNNWAATGTTPVGGTDAALMSGYLDNLQNSGSITVTGLGTAYTSGGYDVLVYQNSDSAGSFGYTVTSGPTTGTRYGRQLAPGGGNYPLAGGTNGYIEGTSTSSAGDATASNYIRIRGLTGSSFTITANAGTTGDGRVRPNGFQIVSVPEPTGAAVVGLASVGLLARRRRRR